MGVVGDGWGVGGGAYTVTTRMISRDKDGNDVSLIGQDRVTFRKGEKDRKQMKLDLPLVEFMYLVFTRMPGESYRRHTLKGVYVPCVYTHAR